MYSSVTCSERQFELTAENSRTIKPSINGLADLLRCPRAVSPVIANLGISENDDLAGVGRIGGDFLVTGKGSIKNDLTLAFAGMTVAVAAEDVAARLRALIMPGIAACRVDLDRF